MFHGFRLDSVLGTGAFTTLRIALAPKPSLTEVLGHLLPKPEFLQQFLRISFKKKEGDGLSEKIHI